MLVRVFGNTYLNPDCVGKLEFSPKFTETERTNTTTIFDVTGQIVLCQLSTKVLLSCGDFRADPTAINRDNFAHEQMRLSISERRDALSFTED